MQLSTNWEGRTIAGGRYRVDRLLGMGGMADVFLAFDLLDQTQVAIKVPKEHLLREKSFLQRFHLEIDSLQRVRHPNVVRITDHGEHGGRPFAVMQYVDQGTLKDRLKSDDSSRAIPIQPHGLHDWLGQTAAALDHMHRSGVVHRDVKPSNILFDSLRNCYLGDFGIVKPMHGKTRLTEPDKRLGTVEYMAPEFILENEADGRADQYGLAVTVFEALAGRCPFVGSTYDVMKSHVEDPPPSVQKFVPEIPAAIARALTRALAKKPADRFPDCSSFARAVLEQLARESKLGLLPRPVRPVFGPDQVSIPTAHTRPPTLPLRFSVPRSKGDYVPWLVAVGALAAMALIFFIVWAVFGNDDRPLAKHDDDEINEPADGESTDNPAGTSSAGSSGEGPAGGSTRNEEEPAADVPRDSIVVCAQGTGDFTTIQAALDWAEPGATITVRAGVYRENLVISKDGLKLSGDASVRRDDVIVAPLSGASVTLTAPTAQVQHLALRAPPGGTIESAAALVTSGKLTIRDCELAADPVGSSGLVVSDRGSAEVHDSLLVDLGTGVSLSGSASVSLAGSDVIHCQVGASVSGSAELKMTRCHVTRSIQHALTAGGQATVHVNDRCAIYSNEAGASASGAIELRGSARLVLNDADLYYNRASAVAVTEQAQAELTGATITNNSRSGILLRGSARVTASGVTIAENVENGIVVENTGSGIPGGVASSWNQVGYSPGNSLDNALAGPRVAVSASSLTTNGQYAIFFATIVDASDRVKLDQLSCIVGGSVFQASGSRAADNRMGISNVSF